MKKIVLIVFAALGFATCTSEEKNTGNPEMTPIVLDFLENPVSIATVTNPIESFVAGADILAVESYNLEEGNAKLMMTKVAEFKAAVVVVDNHTIALVTNNEECRTSLTWGTCMYYSRGYIKKGEMIYTEDFLNNMIGKPDDQKRTIYFFNE